MASAVFVILFGAALILGFFGSRWRAASMKSLSEWSLGGRNFGSVISWFLVGGDIYTGYTFIAIPALMFSTGALGFYALPYCIMLYPLLFIVFPKLWQVAKKHGYVTGPEYVRGRFGNRWLALAIGITGIIATMPYIALQLTSTQVLFGALGWSGSGWLAYAPLTIAFLALAGFSFQSGLRASALLSVLKGVLIYTAVLVAVIVIPLKLGGYGAIFSKAGAKLLLVPPSAHTFAQYSAYGTLALGSAIALYLYPHAITGQFAAASAKVIKRNAITLQAFNLLLGFLAFLGFMAIAGGVASDPAFAAGFKTFGSSFAVPAVLMKYLPDWFVGFCFAAIAVGCLVPAAIMAIGSANIIVRDVWTVFAPWKNAEQESSGARWFSVVMVLGGLFFVVAIPIKEVVNFQLLGGIWIIQTVPAVFLSLYLRKYLTSWGIFWGWLVGIAIGTSMVVANGFASSVFNLPLFGVTIPSYIALAALIPNLIVTFALSPLLRGADKDETAAADYHEEQSAPSATAPTPGTGGLHPAH
ncbi:MAG TPA: sodium:solute symporter [Candidatus Acidoferrales bacterium]|nr:sodium:solute symporter [Candidatus Acidoferrales bacterium]